MRIITLQPSEHTDQITEDGTELTQLPYPFHVTEDGAVERQDFWKGTPARVIGFTARPETRRIDLYWVDAAVTPECAVGMYLVTADSDGTWSTLLYAIESTTVTEVSQ